MKMSGEVRIPAPRQAVWDALNNPEVLRRSIPGAESVEREQENAFLATVKAKVGPVSAKFRGKVTLSDIDAPNGYTLSGEGNGGAAGFAKGSAQVRLQEEEAQTVLSYEVNATVGGKLAQIGQRLIDSTSRKMAEQFFSNLSEVIAPTQEPSEPENAGDGGLPPWLWGSLLIAGVLALIYFFGT